MNNLLKKPIVLLIAAIVIVLLLIGSGYNSLVGLHAAAEGQWAQVETQYQRRFDLIPNLQSIVSGAADFEQSTFLGVAKARTQWQQAPTQEQKMAAVNNFDSALSRLLVTVESYPQLKATEAFRDFSVQLEGTENRIAVARKDYNESVQVYNVSVRRFPKMILARLFDFNEMPFFKSAQDADVAPTVTF